MEYFILTNCKGTISESGEPCKTEYTFDNACEVCGTGAELNGKLRTKGLTKTKKNFIETLDGDYIISEDLYNKLIQSRIKLGILKNIVDSKNNILPFYHLYTGLILPAASLIKGLITSEQCPVCKRNGYFCEAIIGNPKLNISTYIYPVEFSYVDVEKSLLETSDFFFTWECTGLSNRFAHDDYIVRYARPLLIVNESFKSVLEIEKIKGLKFEPVIFIK